MSAAWIDAAAGIEPLEAASFDEGLVSALQKAADASVTRPIRFSTPTFKEFSSEELDGCSKNSFH